MKVLDSIPGDHGKPSDSWVKLSTEEDGFLPEYGMHTTGNKTTCYVPVALGDTIEVGFQIESGVEDFADLLLDGVLRGSMNNKRCAKIWKHNFRAACFAGIQAGSTTPTSLEVCDMQVVKRDDSRGKLNLILNLYYLVAVLLSF
jgi:hypothetical protein